MKTYKTKRRAIDAQAPGGIPPTCGAVFAVCAVFLLMCMTVTPAFAQMPEPEPACDGTGGKGRDFKACTELILDKQAETLVLLEDMTIEMGAMGLLSADQMDAATRQLGFMKDRHMRGREENDDVTDEELDALMAKGPPSECELRLLPRYRMGPPPGDVCTDEEIRANKCEQVCQFSPSENARNEARGLRIEEDLAQALEQTEVLNEELNQQMASLGALSFQTLSTDEMPPDPDPCINVNPHPNGPYPFNPHLIVGAKLTETTAEIVLKMAQNTCKQSVFGNNASLACSALTIIWGLAKDFAVFANTINGNITSATVDATFACAEKLKSESNEQSNALGDLQDDVEDLQDDVTAVKNMLNEVRILLSTPQGLREGFPTK